MSRPLTFTLHRWTPEPLHGDGIERRDYRCDCCDANASYPVACEEPDEAKHLAATTTHVCLPPRFHWDDWRREAFERGMEPGAAAAGRQLLREHDQHGWGGPGPDLEAMMRRGLKSPTAAERRWTRMLEGGNALEMRGRRPSGRIS